MNADTPMSSPEELGAQEPVTPPPRRSRLPRSPITPPAPTADGGPHTPTRRPSARHSAVRRTSAESAPPAEMTLPRVEAVREITMPPRARRASGGPRRRESGVLGLTERARLLPERQSLYGAADALFVALPTIRQAILNHSLDEGARALADGIAHALAPAGARVWIAGPAPWSSSASRVGGADLLPTMRLRAQANTLPGVAAIAFAPEDSAETSPLVEEVVTARQSVVFFDAAQHPFAREWAPDDAEPAWLGTLAAYPLRARGQFLGVLAVATTSKLTTRQLAALEELADLVALAGDRERLLGYSRSHEALAQTVVRHAPVAMALITGPQYLLALANPTFATLLGIPGDTPLDGRLLADVIPDHAHVIAASLRLDAAYTGDEPQAMVELPMHLDRRMTYWNVITSPLPGLALSGGGALVAGVDVTRQVQARQRAQESAEIAQERVAQMMTLHTTSLAVASQLGADPRALLADLLRRSIDLLSARAGVIYGRDSRRESLEVMVYQGLQGDYTGSRLQPGEGVAGQVAFAGKGMIVDDYRTYPFRAALYAYEPLSAVIAVPLIHHGQVVGVLEILDDATQRTFTRDDLWLLDLFAAQAAQAIENARAYVELERAFAKQRELDRLKDDFIATASHELRTPLTGVLGFLELLMGLPAAHVDPLVAEFAREATESAEELGAIAERLLQTARLDTGRIELHTSMVRLAPVVESVVQSFRALQQAQGTTHTFVVEVAPEAALQADLGRLKEILDNLVSNAIKYSPHGSVVTIRCAPAPFGVAGAFDAGEADLLADIPNEADDEGPTIVLPHLIRDDVDGPEDGAVVTAPAQAILAAAQTDPYYVIQVSDQGMGIPEHDYARLFGRFSRLDAARVSQIRGTGLGLYICRELARGMSGDVWLEASAPGQGSTFAIALPEARRTSRRRAAAHAHP